MEKLSLHKPLQSPPPFLRRRPLRRRSLLLLPRFFFAPSVCLSPPLRYARVSSSSDPIGFRSDRGGSVSRSSSAFLEWRRGLWGGFISRSRRLGFLLVNREVSPFFLRFCCRWWRLVVSSWLSSSPDLLFLCFMEVGSGGAETASYFDAQISEIFGVSGLFSRSSSIRLHVVTSGGVSWPDVWSFFFWFSA